MTERQRLASERRNIRLALLNDPARRESRRGGERGSGSFYACVGCYSGIRPWNQGSDYCARCLRGMR